MVANESLLVPSIFSNYWMRMWSRMWRIMQIEEDVIHHGERPRTPFFFSSPRNKQLGCRSGKRGWSMQYHRPLYIQPQIPEISLGTSKWERTISVWSDRNIRGCPLWPSGHFGRSDPNVPFHLTKLLFPVPLFWRTITKRAVAWVRSVQTECTVPLDTWNFRNFKPEFLLNGKRP